MEFNSSGAKIKQYKFQIKGTVSLDAEFYEYLHRIYLRELAESETNLNFYEWVNESVLSNGIMHVQNWCSGLMWTEFDKQKQLDIRNQKIEEIQTAMSTQSEVLK
mgnify:FL=1